MKKLYKVNCPIANRAAVDTGLTDDTVAIEVNYQQTMHASQRATDVSDAFTALQEDLTRLAKFKTNIQTRDLVYLFYLKLDAITDLLEMRRAARACRTVQEQRKNSSRTLNKYIKGFNPIMGKWTYDNVINEYANIITKWNDLKHKIDTLMPTPRFDEYYRRAFFSDTVFKDYKEFTRSPLLYFARKFTMDFTNDSDPNVDTLTMYQSQATDATNELPLDSLTLWDNKISAYLENDGNYICGLMRKLASSGVYKADNGFWQDWKEGDTLPIEDADSVKEIVANIWITQDAPSTWTDEQFTSVYDGRTGLVEINQRQNVGDRGIILAGKFYDHLQGPALVEALQMNDQRDGVKLITTTGMYITSLRFCMYDRKREVYHHTVITGQEDYDEFQYVAQKYQCLTPNFRMLVKHDAASTNTTEWFVNQQGYWRFESDAASMDSFAHAFNVAMLKAKVSELKDREEKSDK